MQQQAAPQSITDNISPACAMDISQRRLLNLSLNWCDQNRKAGYCLAVGAGATVLYYSDRRAATVIAVSKNGRRVTVQHDKQRLLNGATSGAPDALSCHAGGFGAHFSGTQRWETEVDPSGAVEEYSRRVDQRGRVVWVLVGQSTKNGQRLSIGDRSPHYDFNF